MARTTVARHERGRARRHRGSPSSDECARPLRGRLQHVSLVWTAPIRDVSGFVDALRGRTDRSGCTLAGLRRQNRLTADRCLLENPIQPSGNSSVGRAQPCQGWGREFESRFPLQTPHRSTTACLHRLMVRAEWQSGHAAACKAVYAGSIPTSASISSSSRALRPSFTSPMCLSMLPACIARVAELADAADSPGSPTRKRAGAQGSNSGNP